MLLPLFQVLKCGSVQLLPNCQKRRKMRCECDWHIFSTRFRLKQAEKCLLSMVYRLQFSCTGKLSLVGTARAPRRSAIWHPFKREDKYITWSGPLLSMLHALASCTSNTIFRACQKTTCLHWSHSLTRTLYFDSCPHNLMQSRRQD